MNRIAQCHCGQVRLTCEGDPEVVLAGSTRIGIGVGCFADPEFPPPNFSVYEKRRHAWVSLPDGIPRFSDLPDPATMKKWMKRD